MVELGIHNLAKKRSCPECGSTMFRVQIRYRENKTEHYQCINEQCLAKVRIITKTKTTMYIYNFIKEKEKELKSQ